MNKEEIEELTTEILDELWLDMCFTKDYIKHKYEFYKLRDSYYLLKQQNQKYKEVIDKAIEYINKYESIKAYYEYIDEDGYDEYNYDEDFKKELLDILKEVK